MGGAEVQAAVDRGEWEKALAQALAVWRDTRNPVVAQVVLELDRQAGFEGPKGRTKALFERAWRALAAAPSVLAVGWLARTANQKVPLSEERFASFQLGYQQRKYAAWVGRLGALHALPPDPRIAEAMLTVLEEAKFSVGWRDESDVVYGPALALLERSIDAGFRDRALALARRPLATRAAVRAWLEERCAQVRAPEPIPLPDEASWRSLLPREETPAAATADLLAAIRVDPSDRELRVVYADLLQEADDPRGSFISLQLRETEAGAIKQARSLFRKHGSEWLGPDLSRVLIEVEMWAGFLHSAALSANHVADREGWQRAYVEPRLGTLVRLDKGKGNTEHYTAFVTSPATTALEDVGIPRSSVLEAILECPHPRVFTTVRFSALPPGKTLARMASNANLQRLDTLGLAARPRDLGKLLRQAVRACEKHGLGGVRSFALEGHAHQIPFVQLVPVFEELELTRLELGLKDHVLAMQHTPDGVLLEGRGIGAVQLPAVARAMKAPIVAVTLHDDGGRNRYVPPVQATLPELEALDADLPITVLPLP